LQRVPENGDSCTRSWTRIRHRTPAIEDFSVTITRVGTNQKYATGWDSAFGGKKAVKKAAAAAAAKPAAKKASPKKKGDAPKKKAKK
jgi:hypothetical protein